MERLHSLELINILNKFFSVVLELDIGLFSGCQNYKPDIFDFFLQRNPFNSSILTHKKCTRTVAVFSRFRNE